VLRRIFGPKREEVAGDGGRLYNEELHNLFASPNIIRVIMSMYVDDMSEAYSTYTRDEKRTKYFGWKT
jgi:hypothetical protein